MKGRRQDGPTLQSIARQAGVSHQTVANVLNAPDKVAPRTRERVLEVVRAVNYRPNETARSLARRSTRLVSLHVGSGRDYEAPLLNSFQRELARVGAVSGYRIVLDVTPDDDASQIASYEELRASRAVDGVVIPQTHVGDRRPPWLINHSVPVVAFGKPWGQERALHSWVDVDGAAGMRLVAEHLTARGHTRIAYVGPPPDGGMEDDRLAGLVQGLRDHGTDHDPRLRLFVEDPEDLGSLLPQFVDTLHPTALACRDDAFAFSASQVLPQLGLQVGRDIALTGFDDSGLARHTRPGITSVTQPIAQVADLIWSSLVEQFAADTPTPGPSLQRLITPTLTIRESTALLVRSS